MTAQTTLNADGRKWILIANRAGAKIYSTDSGVQELTFVQAIPFPDGRKQNHEIDTDDHGSRFSTVAGRGNVSTHGGNHPSGQQKHGLDRHEEATEHNTNIFARELAHVVYEARTRRSFDELVLAAEPHFLGRLRSAIDKETTNRVVLSVHHNWLDLNDRDLHERLRAELLPAQAPEATLSPNPKHVH